MAWINEIDPAAPADSDLASQGDDQIRELKSALEERMQSLMPGWPADDPLYLLPVTVDLLENRPAVPVGDGQLFLATDNSIPTLYYGSGGAWVTLQTSSAQPPWPNVSTLTAPSAVVIVDSSQCVADEPEYEFDLSWTNGEAALKTLVLVNGQLVHTAAAGIEAAADLTHADLNNVDYALITVLHYDEEAELLSPPVHRVWKPSNPCGASTGILPLANFTLVDASVAGPDYNVDIAIVRNTAGQHVDIYRDGVLVFTLAPTTDTITDENPTGTAMNVYTVVPRIGSDEGPPMTRAIFLPDPGAAGLTAPSGLTATDQTTGCPSTPDYKTLLTWTNEEAEQTRIYAREGSDPFALLVTVGAGQDNYLHDAAFLENERWEYFARHWDGAVESGDSNVALWLATCDE